MAAYIPGTPQVVLRIRIFGAAQDAPGRVEANALTVTEAALDDFIARFEPPATEGKEIIETLP
jgi:hypothetical protein